MTNKRDVTPRRYAEQGKRLQAAREAVGLSRPHVAREVVPEAKRKGQTVYEWEAGVSTPTVAQLVQLCRLYRATADSLLGLPEPELATRLKVVGRVSAAGQVDSLTLEAIEALTRPVSRQEVADVLVDWLRKRASGE